MPLFSYWPPLVEIEPSKCGIRKKQSEKIDIWSCPIIHHHFHDNTALSHSWNTGSSRGSQQRISQATLICKCRERNELWSDESAATLGVLESDPSAAWIMLMPSHRHAALFVSLSPVTSTPGWRCRACFN